MSITLKIRKLREAKGYSQEYMADKLGITQSAYCKMENDDRKINFKNINKITTILGIDLMEIIRMD